MLTKSTSIWSLLLKIRVYAILAWLVLFPFLVAYAQPQAPCEIWGLRIHQQGVKAKDFVFATLNTREALPSCFYETALALYDTLTISNRDSIIGLFDAWIATSTEPWQVSEKKGRWFYLHSRGNELLALPFAFYLQLFQGKINRPMSFENAMAILQYADCDELQLLANSRILDTAWKLLTPARIAKTVLTTVPLERLLFQRLFSCPISCERLDSLYLPTLGYNSDIGYKKMLSSLFAQKNCTQAASYLTSQEAILLMEPHYGGLFQLAMRYERLGQLQKALHFYTLAEKETSDTLRKAACYIGIAHVLHQQQRNRQALDFIQLAIEADPNNSESFVFLAGLYENAIQTCNWTTEVEKCAIELLACQAYKRAGLEKKAEIHRQNSNYQVLLTSGKINTKQKVSLSCFINREVELIP